MRTHKQKTITVILILLAATLTAMAYSTGLLQSGQAATNTVITSGNHDTLVSLSGRLTQDKILLNGDGTVSLELIMTAGDIDVDKTGSDRPVDMVVVIDRSGSMQGEKINQAKQSLLNLINMLSPQDRLALVSYADNVQTHANLLKVTPTNRFLLQSAVNSIRTGGSTNLSSGLQQGITIMQRSLAAGRNGSIILVSDGLANRGITDPQSLGRMATAAQKHEFGISTVGVGLDFNEHLMTTIADQGAGKYYFLDEPEKFAEILHNEFEHARMTVASNTAVEIPLTDGVTLIDAAGYPVEYRNNKAVFYPGNLFAKQSRSLFLTFKLPTNAEKNFVLNGITVRYQHDNISRTVSLDEPFQIACIRNKTQVISSVDKRVWEEKVLQEDFSKLLDEVAADIGNGSRDDAMTAINNYEAEQSERNAAVGSEKVTANLDQDLKVLRHKVEDTFYGAPSAVISKQKKNAKELQYRSYESRRSVQ
jgi:Ca-activated chloride channel family protein